MPKNRRPAGLPRWAIIGGAVVLAAVVVVVVVVVFTGRDAGGTGPRALSADEANRLAITRFRNYEARGRDVTITVPDPAGTLVVTGSVDYRGKLGYGVVRGQGRASSADGLIQWSASTVLVNPVATAPARPPATPPSSGWFHRPLQTEGNTLDSALAIAVGLGSDRPDNAQLLPQNGASWIGTDRIGGRQVEVMAGPASRARPGTAGTVRYWLGPDGTMYRVQVTVASEPKPVDIEFGAPDRDPVRPAPGLTPDR